MYGDLDDIELLQDVEQTFEIRIADDEAQTMLTMGQLETLVRAKVASKTGFDPVWALLDRIARDHSGHKGMIDRETTFFEDIARERQKNG
jgi:hypothetical protein